MTPRDPHRRMVVHVGARRAGEPGWRRDYPFAGSLRAAQDDAGRVAAGYGAVDLFIVDTGAEPEQWWHRPAGGAWEDSHA